MEEKIVRFCQGDYINKGKMSCFLSLQKMPKLKAKAEDAMKPISMNF